MNDPTREVPDLDARLADIDRALRDIQDQLMPSIQTAAAAARLRVGVRPPPAPSADAPPDAPRFSVPPPPTPPPAPSADAPPRPDPPLPRPSRGRAGPLADILQRTPVPTQSAAERLTVRLEQLAERQSEMLQSFGELLRLLDATRTAAAPPPPAPPLHVPEREADEITVAAGPFQSTETVREFAQTLAELRGVRAVAVRGYEGSDRAVIDVRLS